MGRLGISQRHVIPSAPVDLGAVLGHLTGAKVFEIHKLPCALAPPRALMQDLPRAAALGHTGHGCH